MAATSKNTVMQLTLGGYESAFFQDCRLIGLRCALPGYSLCSLLNRCLDLNFMRDLRSELTVDYPQLKKKSQAYNMFESMTETVAPKISYPLFRHTDPTNEDFFYLTYTNKVEGHTLLPDAKWADYLVLFRNGYFTDLAENLVGYLQQMEPVTWAQELIIDDLKSKKYLIL